MYFFRNFAFPVLKKERGSAKIAKKMLFLCEAKFAPNAASFPKAGSITKNVLKTRLWRASSLRLILEKVRSEK